MALVARPTDRAPWPEPTARGSRSKQSSQPHATSAVALLASRAVSKTSEKVVRQRHSLGERSHPRGCDLPFVICGTTRPHRPPFPSWLDCTTNTSGYDFRKGQPHAAHQDLVQGGLPRGGEGPARRRRQAGIHLALRRPGSARAI